MPLSFEVPFPISKVVHQWLKGVIKLSILWGKVTIFPTLATGPVFGVQLNLFRLTLALRSATLHPIVEVPRSTARPILSNTSSQWQEDRILQNLLAID